MAKKEKMDVFFSVFNLHINKAGVRAKRAFIQKFGKDAWDAELAAPWKDGIMAIFDKKPTEKVEWWAKKVEELVNA